MKQDNKRQNFNITPEQEAELDALRLALDAPSIKDALLRAARIALTLARETRRGNAVFLKDAAGLSTRLLIPELEPAGTGRWTFLSGRPHPWRRQLYVKGRKLLASTVWRDMQTNGMTPAEAADNWDLPPAAIEEIAAYCEANTDLLRMEAEEEARLLIEAGVSVQKAHSHGEAQSSSLIMKPPAGAAR